MNGSEKQERAWALSLLFSEGAVGPVTGLTAKAQPALAHHGEVSAGQFHACGDPGERQVENGGTGALAILMLLPAVMTIIKG